MQKVELIAPAGDWSALNSALQSGADGIYFGVQELNMRNTASNFQCSELSKIVAHIHSFQSKAYLTLNTFISQSELPKVKNILMHAKQAHIDAVIAWDGAVLEYARQYQIPVHLSTQASVSNSAAFKLYADLGVERVVLARECSLEQIREIIEYAKKHHINCEIEAFIHGAICVSISGRCFLSSYSFGKSANKGECIQPCRREYRIIDADSQAEYILGTDYLLSPKDLCSIEFIDKLIDSGIHAFKIEGRARRSEYVKVVVENYRKAIDAYYKGTLTEDYKVQLRNNLTKVYNRGFSSGFYFGVPEDAGEGFVATQSQKYYVGEITRYFKKINVAEILVRENSLHKGDTILIAGKTTPSSFAQIEELQIAYKSVDCANKGQSVGVKLPFVVRPKDKVFIWEETSEKK